MQHDCLVPDCARPHRSRGYCGDHYMQARRERWPVPHADWTPHPPREVQGSLFSEPRPAPCMECPPERGEKRRVAHAGPCGRMCIGGVPGETWADWSNEALDAFISRHHRGTGCPHCEDRDAA